MITAAGLENAAWKSLAQNGKKTGNSWHKLTIYEKGVDKPE